MRGTEDMRASARLVDRPPHLRRAFFVPVGFFGECGTISNEALRRSRSWSKHSFVASIP